MKANAGDYSTVTVVNYHWLFPHFSLSPSLINQVRVKMKALGGTGRSELRGTHLGKKRMGGGGGGVEWRGGWVWKI